MNETEEFIINRYAASELAGALILGKVARKTEDPFLRRELVWHCAEEARHATMWENFIQKNKIPAFQIHDKVGKGYFAYFDQVEGMIDFLCFTHVYEYRVPFHFAMHKKWTKNKELQELLKRLIKEEGPHLEWIREYLLETMKVDKKKVLESLKKFSEIERKTYEEDLQALEAMSEDGKEFVKIIRKSLPNHWRAIDENFEKEFGKQSKSVVKT